MRNLGLKFVWFGFWYLAILPKKEISLNLIFFQIIVSFQNSWHA
jgi:hypothetical protein